MAHAFTFAIIIPVAGVALAVAVRVKMSSCRNFFLFLDNFTADITVFTACLTGFITGRFNARNRYDMVSDERKLSCLGFAAAVTGTGLFSLFDAGRILRSDPCAPVVTELGNSFCYRSAAKVTSTGLFAFGDAGRSLSFCPACYAVSKLRNFNTVSVIFGSCRCGTAVCAVM